MIAFNLLAYSMVMLTLTLCSIILLEMSAIPFWMACAITGTAITLAPYLAVLDVIEWLQEHR